MRLLRIAFLVHDIDACGGMERQALLLARELCARGHRVTILCSRSASPSWAGIWPHAEQRGPLHVRWIPLLREVPLETAHELAFLCAASSVLWEGRVDVIYAVQVPSCPLARDLARLLGVPWLVKLAGGGVTGDIAGVVAHEDAARRLEALRQADRVVCLSRQIEEEVARVGVAPERLVHVPNGVDLAALSASAPLASEAVGLPAGARPLLFVGRLDAGKRVDVLLRALAFLRDAGSPAWLLIAGRGPDERDLASLADRLGLAERVRFLGQRDDVPRLLKLAGALVLPSVAEGMSNALLEALATGTPVVATRIPANELLVDDSSAWLVPVDDAEALSRALLAALSDAPEASRRAAEGVRRVAERFDIGPVAADYERLFRELCAAGPRRAGRLGFLHERTRNTRAWLVHQSEVRVRRSISRAVVSVKRLTGRS